MSKFKDLSGQRFGKLVAVETSGYRRTGYLWRCLCDCGEETTVQGTNLRNGHTVSCGHRVPTPVAERFWEKVTQGPECWGWTGARTEAGYGMINVGGVATYAHRVSWDIANGDAGQLYVLHSCDNPSCVRPDHLFLGTHQDNMVDMASKNRWGNQTRKGVANV